MPCAFSASPPSVRRLVEAGSLSAGHARALLTLEDSTHAADLARRAAEEGWSVREVERRARTSRGGNPRRSKAKEEAQPTDPSLRILEEELCAALGTRIRLRGDATVGTIEVPFASPGELERLFALLTGREAGEVLG